MRRETIETALQIDISQLQRTGYIIKGATVQNKVLTWTNGGAVTISSIYTSSAKYITLSYCTTTGGIASIRTYKVSILAKPSNLGIGEVLFFKCPITGAACRKLYAAGDNMLFKSRTAYPERLYYTQQLCSREERPGTRLECLQARKQQITSEKIFPLFRGQITRRFASLMRVTQLQHSIVYGAFQQIAQRATA